MPTCPICYSDLLKPPEDVRDWFRCQTCGTPLQISTMVGKAVFATSVALLLIVFWSISIFLRTHPRFRSLSGIASHLISVSLYASATGIYAFLARLLWKSSLFQPRPCDPYSFLNLSSDRTKLRGNR